MTLPIRPSDLSDKITFPSDVFAAFNFEIRMNYKPWDKEAVVVQDDVIERIIAALNVSRQRIFDEHWMDVEDEYRKAGWSVTYNAMDHSSCPPAPAIYTFKKPALSVRDD
jgi:hypothetical protein